MAIKLTKKVSAILDREKELKDKLDPYLGGGFWDARNAAIEAARSGNATPEQIEEAAAAMDGRLEQKFYGMREVLQNSLNAFREESFPVFREEFLTPALEARKARREQLDKDVADLRTRYPGLRVNYDLQWDDGTISQLQDLVWLDRLGPRLFDMGDMVNFLTTAA